MNHEFAFFILTSIDKQHVKYTKKRRNRRLEKYIQLKQNVK